MSVIESELERMRSTDNRAMLESVAQELAGVYNSMSTLEERFASEKREPPIVNVRPVVNVDVSVLAELVEQLTLTVANLDPSTNVDAVREAVSGQKAPVVSVNVDVSLLVKAIVSLTDSVNAHMAVQARVIELLAAAVDRMSKAEDELHVAPAPAERPLRKIKVTHSGDQSIVEEVL